MSLKALIVAAAALGLAACSHAPAPAYTTKGPIEAKYQATGPWTVSRTVSATPCDREEQLCDIWYPSELGTNPIKGLTRGFRHPMISWANGSGQTPEVYEDYLRHLASWGFIVVAARDKSTGNGDTTIDATRYMIAEAESPSSLFYNRIDVAKIGAAGHSQGGASITNLHARADPLFKTYLGFHTAPWFFSKHCCAVVPDSYIGTQVTASIFQWSSTPDSGTPDWYDPIPASAPKAYALLKYARHADVAGKPGCENVSCAQGPYGYLGYSTAWLMWQLQGAADGGEAFRQNGEFFRPNLGWSMNLSNIP